MSNFFNKKRKFPQLQWFVLAVIAVVLLFFAFHVIKSSATICLAADNTMAFLEGYFAKPSQQSFVSAFEEKYGKDYICVWDEENATLVCKYPQYNIKKAKNE